MGSRARGGPGGVAVMRRICWWLCRSDNAGGTQGSDWVRGPMLVCKRNLRRAPRVAPPFKTRYRVGVLPVCSLGVNPVGAARAFWTGVAIGRGPLRRCGVRAPGGLVRAVCSAWRSSLWRWDAAAREGRAEGPC